MYELADGARVATSVPAPTRQSWLYSPCGQNQHGRMYPGRRFPLSLGKGAAQDHTTYVVPVASATAVSAGCTDVGRLAYVASRGGEELWHGT